jgi:hypothetical protein
MPLPRQAAINQAGDKRNSPWKTFLKHQFPSLDAVPNATPSGWSMIEDKNPKSLMPPNNERVPMLGEITEEAAAVPIDGVRQHDKSANVNDDDDDNRNEGGRLGTFNIYLHYLFEVFFGSRLCLTRYNSSMAMP